MNHTFPYSSKLSGVVLTAILSGLLPGVVHAQNVYFDPNDTGTAAGGSGEFNGATSWESGGTDGAFASGSGAYFGDSAYFDGAAGTVTVNAPVNATYIEVGVTSGTETIGTTGAHASQITLPAGFGEDPPDYPNNELNPINVDTGSENVIFNSNINLNVFNRYYNDLSVNSASTGNVAFNGGITFTNNTNDTTDPYNQSMGEPDVELYASNGGSFTLNSTINEVDVQGSQPNGNAPYINFQVASTSTSSTLTLANGTTFEGVRMVVDSGTVLDQGATYTATATGGAEFIQVDGTGQYLTDADNLDVLTTVQNNGGDLTVGGYLADDTTFSGTITNYGGGGEIDLTAVAGGTVTFTNSIGFNSNTSLPINKIGAGTVILTYANNGFGGKTEIKNGTLLLNANNALTSQAGTVVIDEVLPANVTAAQTEATFGGDGSMLGSVVANGPDSVIAPGIGTNIAALYLYGGLVAQDGLTLDFKLNGGDESGHGVTNDYIYASTLTLNGLVTVNIENLGTITTGTPYILMSGGGTAKAWKGKPVFVFDVPTGYALDPSFGTPDGLRDGNDLGYVFSTNADDLAVQFIAVPEPSTCAMWLGGLALLGFIVRRKAALIG
jgi:hypothetical protein